ncbi:uncharacterized protein LOC112562651 [Pomacea canaliculata]|uniref:uncharacterized protein LOC112562651 n=1 Tax=Pomacea canaliculata TaxID=400727 RepID=UPI000D7360A3|nr:uncharacterized protein LOC112562651 [Pomacea canaliculata]
MAFSTICILVLMTAAMTRSAMTAPAASLSVMRGHLVRVICDVKATGSSMILERKTDGCNEIQEATVKTNESPESERQQASKEVAVHGFIDTNKNRSFLEISFLEFLPVEIAPNYMCKLFGDGKENNTPNNVTPYRFVQAVDIFRCDLELEKPANDIYMEIVEINGDHESFVGPKKTSIKDVDEGMQQFNGLKNESAGRTTNITVFLRTSYSLIVAQPAERFSSSAKYFCRITRNNEITPRYSPDNNPAQSYKGPKVVDEERNFVWLGYPVLGILLLVVSGLYIRERRMRWRLTQERGGNLLELGDPR